MTSSRPPKECTECNVLVAYHCTQVHPTVRSGTASVAEWWTMRVCHQPSTGSVVHAAAKTGTKRSIISMHKHTAGCAAPCVCLPVLRLKPAMSLGGDQGWMHGRH